LQPQKREAPLGNKIENGLSFWGDLGGYTKKAIIDILDKNKRENNVEQIK